VGFEPKFVDDVAHVRNLRIGGVGFHDDKHVVPILI